MKYSSKTKSMYERACQVMPWGVSSNFRYWGKETPVVARSQGAYIWDVDDNKFIDYRLAFGPIILGHADPRVTKRVHEEMDKGTLFAHTQVLEVEVAERIVRMCPGVEKVRFTNSGTEATMHALRIARAFTNREKVIKFEGNYHGFHDYLLFSTAYTADGSIGSRKNPIPVKNSSGIPAAIQDLIIVLPFNDYEMLEKTVREHWADIAAIIVEPIAANMTSIPAEKSWLELMRQLCDEFGIVMIMDEVKTGFRIAKGGATEFYGVKGDLMTYAKSLANGFPLAALGGKKEVMDVIEPGRVAQGGTYCGNVLGTAAAVATLEILETTDALKTVAVRGKKLMDGIHDVLSNAGEEHTVVGVPAMFSFILGLSKPPQEFRDLLSINVDRYELIHSGMRARGIEYELDAKEPLFLCEAHLDSDVDTTLNALEDTLKELRIR